MESRLLDLAVTLPVSVADVLTPVYVDSQIPGLIHRGVQNETGFPTAATGNVQKTFQVVCWFAGVEKMKVSLGRHLYGLAAILFGIITVAWHDFNTWQQIQVLGNLPHREILLYFAAAVEILGGVAIQWRRTARGGAVALGCLYLVFALMWVPRIAVEPMVYDRWGNFFEQFSLVSGALVAYGSLGLPGTEREASIARVGYLCFGVCVISFTLEQLFYLSGTASFVPKWIPPGQMFWAVTTTIAFALAAIALLSGWMALLASQLTTAMIVGFGLFVWLPALADPHKLINWAGNAQNLAIAGSAWIVTDYLRARGSTAAHT